MFGRQRRYNWYFLIKAKYQDLESRLLPLPLQTERSAIEDLFVDFKEVKFQTNLFKKQKSCRAYALYLFRKYPVYRGQPIKKIIFELYQQNITPLAEIGPDMSYLNDETRTYIFEEYEFPAKYKNNEKTH